MKIENTQVKGGGEIKDLEFIGVEARMVCLLPATVTQIIQNQKNADGEKNLDKHLRNGTSKMNISTNNGFFDVRLTKMYIQKAEMH